MRSNVSFGLAALGITIAAIALTTRLHNINTFSLWLDDFFTLEAATGRGQLHDDLPLNQLIAPGPAFTSFQSGPGLIKIWSNLRTVAHPPLYFMALNIWSRVFGSGDVAARSLSVVWSLIGIGLLFDCVRLHYGAKFGLWAAAIAAAAGPQVVFSQQVRSYTMTMTLILWAADVVTRIELFGFTRRRRLLLVLSLLATMLTHYLAAGAGVALFLFVLIRFRGRALWDGIGCFIVAGAIYGVIWGPFFVEQSREFARELNFLIDVGNQNLFSRTLRHFAAIPLRMITQPMQNSIIASRLSVAAFVLPFLLLRQNPRILLMALLTVCPAVEVAGRDLLNHGIAVETLRYVYFSSMPLYAVLACLLAHRKGWTRHFLPAITLAGCFMTLDQAYFLGQADLREPAHALREHMQDGGIVLFNKYNPADWRSAAYCLELCHYSRNAAPLALIDRPPDGILLQQLRAAPQVLFCSKDAPQFLTKILPPDAIHCYRDFPMAGAIYEVDLSRLGGDPTIDAVR